MPHVAIGLGANLGDPPRMLRDALRELTQFGQLVAVSSLYRTKPWGEPDQLDFYNAVALVETRLSPRDLLAALKDLERRLGRRPSKRWGPRLIDLDILLYGDERVDEPDLQIPHPRLLERAFALVPLAEVDSRYAPAAAALGTEERAGVFRVEGSERGALMSDDLQFAGEHTAPLADRVRALAQAFLETDLVRLRIQEANADCVELRRRPVPVAPAGEALGAVEHAPPPPAHLESIKADLVGIFHFSRPTVLEGELLDRDRELAYVEALGIRNPVRSFGPGRIVSIRCQDGQPVEYGQTLFEIDRG
jgi:2-amino-4-hydroxy-6-hydroxymethyldihydropteridine diphosphokinase